ncbi:MAG: DNA translocase FtsK 4TM domain-containing protein, partial [Bacteroidota bacterium]
MAKKKKGQLSFKIDMKDERVPKLMGILCLFFALYLFIAFTSYIFTWAEDQDRVFRFSWGLLLQSDLEMANWLGRLGAIISNMFFYWGFGLPSFILIFLLTVMGIALIKGTSWRKRVMVLRYSLLSMAFLAVVLAFIFQHSTFPWGGAFGEGISSYLIKFVGNIGTIIIFIFAILGGITWAFNPDYRSLTLPKAIREIRTYVAEIFNTRPRRAPVAVPAKPAPKKTATLKPKKAKTPKVEPPATIEEDLAEGQLSLNMKTKRPTPKSLKVGEAELEIEIPNTPIPAADVPIEQVSAPPQTELAIQSENKDHKEPYDPTLDLSAYDYPVLPLLKDYADQKIEIDRAELEQNKDQIIETLLNYKIEITRISATIGPTVTLYEIVPAPGVRISKIKNLEDDIALSLSALGIRIIAPIPGRGTIGIEVPNKKKQIVSLKETLMSDKFKKAKMDLPIALGKTISNEVFVADLAKMPHLLIAGATGQGKSVGINTILMSILYKKHPSQVKLVLIDPKKVELFPYAQLEHHFLAFLPGQDEPIVTETNKVIHTLNSLCIEMDQRYNLLKKAHARNIREYNEKFVSRRLNPQKGHKFL